jgi:hypothetical protein
VRRKLTINIGELTFVSVANFNLVGVDSPPLCGEEDELQSESLGSGANAASIHRVLSGAAKGF